MRVPLLFTLATIALGAALASCGSDEEVAPVVTPVPTTDLPTAPTPARSPAVIPADWLTQVDPVLGFSLRYPPDLVFKDLTGPSPVVGVNERAFEFRSATEPHRGFTISVSSNAEGFAPKSWLLDHAACLPGTIVAGSIGGQPAAFCTSEPADIPEAAVAFPQMDKMIFMTSIMPPAEFELVVASLQR